MLFPEAVISDMLTEGPITGPPNCADAIHTFIITTTDKTEMIERNRIFIFYTCTG
jgi:hypothetical protein